jgi:hypothetical protein
VNYAGGCKVGAKFATVEGQPLEGIRISADGDR